MIRTVFLYYQVTLDTLASLSCLYMGLAITNEFGLGSRHEIWQLLHRVAFALATAGWAYHATDLLVHPAEHGLTFSNVFLHTGVLICMAIASVRIWRFQHDRNGNGIKKSANGSLMTGPFFRR